MTNAAAENRRRIFQTHIDRFELHRAGFRHANIFDVRTFAPARPTEHFVAHFESRDVFADLNHTSGKFHAGGNGLSRFGQANEDSEDKVVGSPDA